MNCISPGAVDSSMMAESKKVTDAGVIAWTVQQQSGRVGRPEEMAAPLVFLNSDEASYVNGHNLVVDAGLSAALATDQLGA